MKERAQLILDMLVLRVARSNGLYAPYLDVRELSGVRGVVEKQDWSLPISLLASARGSTRVVSTQIKSSFNVIPGHGLLSIFQVSSISGQLL